MKKKVFHAVVTLMRHCDPVVTLRALKNKAPPPPKKKKKKQERKKDKAGLQTGLVFLQVSRGEEDSNMSADVVMIEKTVVLSHPEPFRPVDENAQPPIGLRE